MLLGCFRMIDVALGESGRFTDNPVRATIFPGAKSTWTMKNRRGNNRLFPAAEAKPRKGDGRRGVAKGRGQANRGDVQPSPAADDSELKSKKRKLVAAEEDLADLKVKLDGATSTRQHGLIAELRCDVVPPSHVRCSQSTNGENHHHRVTSRRWPV